mmetsp:Transcript_9552/g.18119  ORF Transcript_9552/g.18119 Transcript_9552/m.18119 type:complete len:717 (+) Transcript_9552:36-2186(+)|eukprot:CAMPEP_0175139416 /NCGR_PEP_ID=MMETSP0087-20121206/10888_1 /TAXON_ID=136419 /ORGANISM="Unknown Unknown, Strain D1" /LENGTH=716 /DNA_ID=CAMNT_0016422419 /DNA_START=36 /DNA_END=2186 /DNA_ORIENTATION=+
MKFLGALLTIGFTSGLVSGPWSSVSDPPEKRAKALLDQMTLDEKLSMLHGPQTGPCCQCNSSASCAYVGNINAIDRLEIPPVTMNDGPQGFRDNNHPGTTTAWPSGLTMAASWDVDAMKEWGTGMGKEFYAKGANVQLGPGLCLARVPRNGRNFEYLSGEDPFLGYTLVQPVIKGIQSQKVVANAKHYILNNQETNRGAVSEETDERTRFEMYYPPFAGAVAAEVGSVMCSYNKINGVWSCENPVTLKGDLKNSTGFKGYVMSDWGATHSPSIMEGLDVEMPSANFMNAQNLNAMLKNGTVTQAAVDDSVFRILYAMFAVGVMDEPASAWDWKKLKVNATTDASAASARHLSAISTVLLKNEGSVLPLPKIGTNKFAVLGFGSDNAVVHGGGSGSVVPSYVAKPVDAITSAAGKDAFVSYDDGTDLDSAAKIAAASDYAIVFVGTLSHEGGDRASLSLDDGCDTSSQSNQCQGNRNKQNALIEAVAAVNPRTIVVCSIPGSILMPWSTNENITSIVTNFLGGQQAGNAIADVLFGDVNPSGKLPLTMPNEENEMNFSTEQWPGLPDPSKPLYAMYSEELLVGYRYYDAKDIKFTTGFPFGHGLSYTSFHYHELQVSGSSSVSFKLENTGKVVGAEVAQLYLGFPETAGEPPRQLKGFQKVVLQPGETKSVEISLTPRDLSIWDAKTHEFAVVKGEFDVFVGSSSRDLRLLGKLYSK